MVKLLPKVFLLLRSYFIEHKLFVNRSKGQTHEYVEKVLYKFLEGKGNLLEQEVLAILTTREAGFCFK